MDMIVEAARRLKCTSFSGLEEGVRSDDTRIVASFI
jgi:hypothetical protein